MSRATIGSVDAMALLARSRALWNRSRLDLESDEMLAQILDRGSLADWRSLYLLMSAEGEQAIRLRRRVCLTVHRVPVARPHLWLAALVSLGFPVDWVERLPPSEGEADI